MRSLRQTELEAQYQIELATLRDRQRDKDGAAIRESFLEQIRRWYIDHHENSGKFPDLPAEDEGGSKIIYNMADRPVETPVPVAVKKVRIPSLRGKLLSVISYKAIKTNRVLIYSPYNHKERDSAAYGQKFQ